MALVIKREELFIAESEHFWIGFDFLLLFWKFEGLFLELFEAGLVVGDLVDGLVVCAL